MSSRITMHFPVFHGEHQVAQEQLTGLETDALRPRGNCNLYKRKICIRNTLIMICPRRTLSEMSFGS
jgi:hypothetical protein